MNIEEIREVLAAKLKPARFQHSLGVMAAAKRLAEKYGAASDKAELAGLLHDCARIYENDELTARARQALITPDEIEAAAPLLLHAPLGAVIAAEQFGINDEEILQAIRLHTTGGIMMTVLDKIIYLADMIEPSRVYPNVDKLRSAAEQNLDKAMLLAFNQSINYVIERGQLVHINTIQARNELILGGKSNAEET